jgi:hypothetical protein
MAIDADALVGCDDIGQLYGYVVAGRAVVGYEYLQLLVGLRACGLERPEKARESLERWNADGYERFVVSIPS